jgi:hypothetical protein
MTIPELFLLIVVISLVVMAVSASMKFTKGTSSLSELKWYLKVLQLKLSNPSTVDADKERVEVDMLLNRLKTTNPQKTLSHDEELKGLFTTTSQQIQQITDSKETGLRTSWQKLKTVVCDFNEFYYPKR